MPFRAVFADSLYGEHDGFRTGLHKLKLGFVLALKPSHAWWHLDDQFGALQDISAATPWQDATHPGLWIAIPRSFRDGHTKMW